MKRALVFMIPLLMVGPSFAQDVITDGQDTPGLKVGSVAPEFTAPTDAGHKVTLSDYYKKGPVILIFYRGAWCPHCNLHLKSFQDRLEDFKKLGATILAVSVDKPEYGAKTVQKDGLGFEVVSDPQADILSAYNVIYKVPDDLAEKYLREYHIDLQAHSGRKDHVIAVPATYVIDKSGKIVFAYANMDYKVRTRPEEVLDVLKIIEQEVD